MNNLFEEFINERKYFRKLSERTLRFYRETYHYFNQVGAFENLSKQSLQKAIVIFRERGATVGGINAYIRGVNTYLKWLSEEHGYENLSLKKLKGNHRLLRSLTDDELKAIVRHKPKTISEKRLHVGNCDKLLIYLSLMEFVISKIMLQILQNLGSENLNKPHRNCCLN